jgi:hypothetical protein
MFMTKPTEQYPHWLPLFVASAHAASLIGIEPSAP